MKIKDLTPEIALVTEYYELNPDAGHIVVRSVTHDKRSVTKAIEKMRGAFAVDAVSEDDIAEMNLVPGWDWEYSAPLWAEAEPKFRALVEDTGSAIFALGYGGAAVREAAPYKLLPKAQKLCAQNRLNADVIANFESLPGWSWDPRETDFASLLAGYLHACDGEHLFELERLGLEEFIAGRNDLTADEVAAVEALPGWAWNYNVIAARFVAKASADFDAEVVIYDLSYAEFQAWADAGCPDGGEVEYPDRPELNASARYWLEQNGGPEAVVWILAEHEWKENGTPLPAPTAADMDLLTRVITFVAEHGHSDFAWELTSAVREWRSEPTHVHPFIRDALNTMDGWYWLHTEATFRRGQPFMDQFVAKTGTSIVPLDHMEGDFKLGKWAWGFVANHHRSGRYPNLPAFIQEYFAGLPGWQPRSDRYEEAAANAAWMAFYAEHGHAGILSIETVWGSDLETKVRRWTNGGYAHHDEPKYPDVTFSLPDFPVGLSGARARTEMELTAVRRMLAVFRAREGHDAKLPLDQMEGKLPLGRLAHIIVSEFRWAVKVDRARLREELLDLFAELEAVAQPIQAGHHFGYRE